MMDYLPSKNFIVLLFMVLLIAGGGWLLIQGGKWLLAPFFPNLATTTEISAPSSADEAYGTAARDTDKDGLKDWEEAIWSTDIRNPDTDGDGTSDGEEVKARRDPAKAAPGDTLTSQTTAPNSAAKPKTVTESINHDLNVRYFTLKGLAEGLPLSEDQKKVLSGAFGDSIQKQADDLNKNTYAERDVTVSINKSPKTYLNELGGALAKYTGSITTTEIDIVRIAGETNDKTKLQQLDRYITAYQNMITFLKKESVPPAYVSLHAELLNIMNNMHTLVLNMQQLFTDPLLVAAAVEAYPQQILRFTQFISNLKTQIEKDRVQIGSGDPASFFNPYFAKF